MAAGFVHIAASFSIVEDPLLSGNILLALVHRDTPFLFDQNVRSVLRGRIYLHRAGLTSLQQAAIWPFQKLSRCVLGQNTLQRATVHS